MRLAAGHARRKARLARRSGLRAGLTLAEQIIVILIIGVLLAIFAPIVTEFSFLQTSGDQASNLGRALAASRAKSIKSNEMIYFEFNLDEKQYRSYSYERQDGELEESVHIEKTDARIAAVAAGNGKRVVEGKFTVRFLPSGVGEELSVYLGPSDLEIESTLVFSRYGGEFHTEPGEYEPELEKPQWSHEPR